MSTILSDLRHGARLLFKSPGFAAIAILALALGLGANTAIFSLVDRLLIRPLPFGDPSRLVMVWEDASFISFPRNTPAVANFVDWKKQNQVFTDMAATRGRSASLTGDGSPEMILGRGVTANLFDVLGVKPMLGRTFTDQEDHDGDRVVVIAYGLWQSRYGTRPEHHRPRHPDERDQDDGDRRDAAGFHFSEPPDQILGPRPLQPREWNRRGSHYLNVIARLKPGVTLARAQADMTTIARRLEQQYPDTNLHVGATVIPMKDQMVGNTGIALLVLLGAAACVLLIACSNVANLLLAKAAGREREMAIRTALGAARTRLIRQMLTESLLLAVIGGALGLLIARLSLRILVSLIPASFSISTALSLGSPAPGVQLGRLAAYWPDLRTRARAPAHVVRYRRKAEGRRTHRRRRAQPPFSRRAGSRRGRAGADPARIGRPAASNVAQCSGDRRWIQSRQDPHAYDAPAVSQVC